MRLALFVLLLAAVPASAQSFEDRGDLEWREAQSGTDYWRWQYPRWAYYQIRGSEIDRKYDLSWASNPFLLNGDFDGDGRLDVAAWVKDRSAIGSIGVVVVHRAGGVHFFEAGDLNWQVYPQGYVGRGATDEAPPELVGDALLFEQPESASYLMYWTGTEYARYQQGD